MPSDRDALILSWHHLTSSGVGPHASPGIQPSGTREMRKRLRRPALLAGNVDRRHRTLFDRKQGTPGEAVEHEDVAHLGVDDDGGRAVLPGEQGRLRGHVVVPQVVVNDLKSPDEGARRGAQGHHRVGPLVVALADAAVVVRAGTAGRNEDEIAARDRRRASTRRCRHRCEASSRRPRESGSRSSAALPVRASKARTMPRSVSTFQLSAIEEPTMTRSSETAGAEVT